MRLRFLSACVVLGLPAMWYPEGCAQTGYRQEPGVESIARVDRGAGGTSGTGSQPAAAQAGRGTATGQVRTGDGTDAGVGGNYPGTKP